MEAVPRLPMISFDLRQPDEPVDFSRKLKQYIKNHYHENPDKFSSDIKQMDDLRAAAANPPKDIGGCLLMKRYYCQLHFLAGRFPMMKEGPAGIKFSWKLMNNHGSTTVADMVFELSVILFNIGALHTQLGAEDSRITAEGMKMSCTHFQCAAWAFQHLGEQYASSNGLDLTLDLLHFMSTVCLGQAQECILEKSMLDNRKATIISKVTVQVIEYYRQALRVLAEDDEFIITDTVGSKVFKKWERYLKFKISYLGSISFLFQGQHAEEQQKMGERVAYYQAAFDKLEEARKLARSLDNIETVDEALTFVHDVVEGKRKAAKNENEFVYHEEVPDLNLLATVRGASLVKGIPFDVNDPEISGPELFSKLVPMKAHESSSLYSEEKAKLLRKILAKIDAKDDALDEFLSTLQLDDLTKPSESELPQEMIDKCCAFNAKPNAVKNLLENMTTLTDTYQEVDAMLREIRKSLSEEEKREKEYQATIGKRPPTIAATDLTREAKRYQEAQTKATESNRTLNKALLQHLPYLKLMLSPLKEVISEIPKIVDSPEVEASINEMRLLLDKVREMKEQRLMLKEKFKDDICKDDILKKLVTYNSDKLQPLFDSELEKHQHLVAIIEQNLVAQDNIVKAVKEAYARYGTFRRETAIKQRRRDTMIASLIAAHDAYDDLLAMSSKGVDFYKKLHVNVSKLLQRVRGTCMVQNEEREQIIKNVKGLEGQDIPQPTALKLKDYLDMKKQFGNITLGKLPSHLTNTYVKPADQPPKQHLLPGIRPAPLGSEESNASRYDDFSAVFKKRDRTWSRSPQQPSNSDDKAKYYVPQNPVVSEARYPTESAAQSVPQDIYPISAYSSVMPNASTTGYAGPKSNYYNTENSPSRYINPPHFYADHNQPVISSYSTAQHSAGSSYSQEKSVTDKGSPVPSSYSPVAYPYPSQPVSSGYMSTYSTAQPGAVSDAYLDTSQSGNYQYSGTYDDIKNPGQNIPSQYSSYDASGIDPFSVSQQAFTQYTSNYNLGNTSKLPSYAMGIKYDSVVQPQSTNYSSQAQTYPIQSVAEAYAVAGGQPAPNYYVQTSSSDSDLAQNFPATNMPVTQSEFPYVANNFTTQHFQADTNGLSFNTVWPQASTSTSNVSMPQSVNPSQSLQSGSESLYTACQTNNYSLTSSEVYKSLDGQNQAAYPTNQYYVSQYGSSPNGLSHQNLACGNSATYIQAGADKQKATTTTTYSNNDSKSSPISEHSNVDLLAGLDFNVGQCPLVPEAPASSDNAGAASVKSEKASQEEKSEPVQEPSNLNIKKELFQDVAASKESSIDAEKLSQDVEKYEKFVESLTLKTLNGPTCLDIKWKEISDLQDKSTHLHIISVARCYPMKNRFPDILPYDDSRIELPSTKDDYINASLAKNLSSNCPNFILTQAPLPSTYGDFWAMVFEQQVEVIVCLLNSAELDDQIYFPKEKGQELALGKLKISLQSSNVKPHWVERIMSVCVADTRATRVVIHLQFTSWPGSSFPESPGPFLSFASECINYFNQQRSSSHPVVVHCTSGVGRTGLFCLIITAIQDIQAGKGIPDLVAITGQMSQYRKSPLRDREHLKFAYQAVLYYCQDLLMKRGFLTNKSAFDDRKLKEGKCHTRHPSEDFLLGPPTDLSQLQSGIEKFGFECSGNKTDGDAGANRSQSACSRRDSATNSCTSSGRTSPSSLPSDVLSTLDPATFNIKMDGNKGKKNAKKRYSTESFAKKSEPNLEGFDTESEDPLSRLDPLWTMKK